MYRKISTFIVAFCPMAGFACQEADTLSFRLNEVCVVPDPLVSRWEGSTLVSTVAGTPLARLGNALDVLAQLPMTTVSDDGVSVPGRGIPEIYIDGRPVHDITELRTLQSDNIRKVELLMAPGAQYDAATRSVLKISTRRNFIAGLSAMEEAEVKARRRWSASDELVLRYFAGNWEVFGEGLLWHSDSQVKGKTVQRFLYDGLPMEIGSTQNRTTPANEAMGCIGFNYAAGGKSFGGYYRADRVRSRLYNTGREWMDGEPELLRTIRMGSNRLNRSVALYYDEEGAEKRHLHFDGAFRCHDMKSNSVTAYSAASGLPAVCSDQDNPCLFGAAKLYVEFPWRGGIMTLGTEDSYTRTDLDYRMSNEAVSAYIPSSFTRTRQGAYAAFASWQRRFKKVGFNVGARYEHVGYSYSADGGTGVSMSRHDDFLSPDLSCDIDFSDDASLSFSYRMSAVRPPYARLTGGLVYTGRHEIEGGNSALRDEHRHCFRFFGMWHDFMAQIEYCRARDTYGFVKELYSAPSPQVLMHPVNLDVSSMSAFLIWSRKIRGWMPDVTLGCSPQWLSWRGEKYDSPMFSYRWNNIFSLPRRWMLTAAFSGNSAGHIHTQKFEASWFVMDVSVRKTFFSDCFDVRLGANNIFRTDHNGWMLRSCGIIAEKCQSYDSRSMTLTLSYKFRPRKSGYLGGTVSETEAKRL